MSWFRVAAATNVLVHLGGLALAALAMRPGTPLAGTSRVAWLAEAPAAWAIGWSLWIVCALALVVFVTMAVRRSDASPRAARWVVALVVAGAAIDVACNAIWIGWIPGLAARDSNGFLAAERALGAIGQIGANGLYSTAVLIMAFAFDHKVVRWLAIGTFVAGMAMVVAGITGNPQLLAASTGPTIALACAWTIGVAIVAPRRHAEAPRLVGKP